ncbi:MAG: hypothetical protein WC124_02245 [Desulfoplanes sp.]
MCGGSGGGGGGGGGGGPSPENSLSGDDVSKYSSTIMKTSGSVDISKPVTITISGNTYAHKDTLKSEGFKYDSGDKSWSQTVEGKSKNSIMGKIEDVGRWKPKVKGAKRGYEDMTARLSN